MFKLFRSKRPYEPLNYERRKYFEQNLLWLKQEFPDPDIKERKQLTPTPEDFPITWDGSEHSAHVALEIICAQMQIDTSKVTLEFYDNPESETNLGGIPIFLQSTADSTNAAGMYSQSWMGVYEIALDRDLLTRPEDLIGVMAHELCHGKLLGELGMEENDELLTDFGTVFYGLGIFNANAAFRFNQSSDRWGYRRTGYLSVEEWAYALALFAFIRYEDDPSWATHLSKTITGDFKKSLQYLLDHEDEIFQFDPNQI